uniref:Uncharacterized protein n=1 Tax=Arundo donax TaxID=35708 RepID=A0A0A8ZJG2_ARUDO
MTFVHLGLVNLYLPIVSFELQFGIHGLLLLFITHMKNIF